MRRLGLIILAFALVVVVFVAYVAYESVPSTQHTTTVVSTAGNLVAVTGQLPSSSCVQPAGAYGNTSLTINWGNLAPGTEGIQFLCIENTGTIRVNLTVTSTLSTAIGRVTSPEAGTVLNGKGAELMELDLWLSSSVQTGPISSFTITIGGES
ncbi:MAG: hypothetical protein LYZ69_06530 [Nitrososphaerales archaeon]|nr:hypothetical protein [Nitrososphaerales archaeon]